VKCSGDCRGTPEAGGIALQEQQHFELFDILDVPVQKASNADRTLCAFRQDGHPND
jgi:hypothetical protein